MTNSDNQDKNTETKNTDTDFHGAAIIDENGQEIPITEEMVQKACEKLDKSIHNKG